jgi:hypothetical protein
MTREATLSLYIVSPRQQSLQMDPQFAYALDHLSALYRKKSEIMASDRPQLTKLADTAHADAMKIRDRLKNRPSRFSDQFSRPSLPPAP